VPNAIAIALGALGLIGPPLAAVINNGATFLAVLVGTLPLLKMPERHPQAEAGEVEYDTTPEPEDMIDASAGLRGLRPLLTAGQKGGWNQ